MVKIMEQKEFIKRLVELRQNKGVSARDMSLSIGQSAGYINNIENGINYPSMTIFFYICDYLGITPKEFFDVDSKNPTKTNELIEATKGLSSEQLDTLISLAKNLIK
jgi:transcriptional regulator with XRE-family HTH domain